MFENSFKEKKIDSRELAQALDNLTDAEKLRIFYMMKGIELMRGQEKKEVMLAAM